MTDTTGAAASRDFTVIAIISAHNEEDIIGQVLRGVIAEGVLAYLIDDASTDRTVAEAEPFLGRGLLAIERLTASNPGEYDWTAILRRKEQLAQELDADWFIHHDADEFRESVWGDMTLRDAIHLVDRAGYSAIDFALLNFWPTHDRFQRGDDPRASFPYYEPGQAFNRVQVRCWKKTAARIDLVIKGGHDARFDGRRVFPLRFLLRHYPIRTQAHAEQKIFQERRPRFRTVERERGWHYHYEDVAPGARFVRDPATLVAYDPTMVRLALHLSTRTVGELQGQIEELQGQIEELQGQIEALQDRLRNTQAEVRAQRRIVEAVLGARTWRWTAPVRHVSTWMRRSWRAVSSNRTETER